MEDEEMPTTLQKEEESLDNFEQRSLMALTESNVAKLKTAINVAD